MARIQQLNARLDKILKIKDASDRVLEATNELLRLSTPDNWNAHIKGNAEVRTEREAERLILSVGEHTKEDLDKCTVFRFYSIIDFIKEKHKAQNG
jgi:hypothetical protein